MLLTFLERYRQRLPIHDRLVQPLVDRGHGLIYDVARDITWLQDVNHAETVGHSPGGRLTWTQAQAFVAGLDYHGIRGWRLPSALNPDGSGPCVGENCSRSEIGHLVFGPFTSHPGIVTFVNQTLPCIYWTGTEASATEAYAFDMFNLRQGTLPKNPGEDGIPVLRPVLAWPVHDGDVAALIGNRWSRLLFDFLRDPFGTRVDRER